MKSLRRWFDSRGRSQRWSIVLSTVWRVHTSNPIVHLPWIREILPLLSQPSCSSCSVSEMCSLEGSMHSPQYGSEAWAAASLQALHQLFEILHGRCLPSPLIHSVTCVYQQIHSCWFYIADTPTSPLLKCSHHWPLGALSVGSRVPLPDPCTQSIYLFLASFSSFVSHPFSLFLVSKFLGPQADLKLTS